MNKLKSNHSSSTTKQISRLKFKFIIITTTKITI